MALKHGSTLGAPQIQRGGWLDALRFIAASMMIVHHYHEAGPVPLETFNPVFDRGYLLTNFFLIDSGYVLARIYSGRLGQGVGSVAFFARRAGRLIPGHLVMILALAALVGVTTLTGHAPRHPEWFDWNQFPAQFFLVQAFGVPGGIGWNAPTWSASALLGCYLAFPFLVRRIGRLTPWNALGFGVTFYLVANLLTQHYLGYPVYQMPLRHGFLRALPLFLMGVALARFSQGTVIPTWLAQAMGAAAVVALVGLQTFGAFSLLSLALICVLIVMAAAIPVIRPSRLVERAALATFSIFISNEVVRIGWFGMANAVIERFSLSLPLQWALWAGGVVSALVFAFIFQAAFDAPTQLWVADVIRRRSTEFAAIAERLRALLPRPMYGDEMPAVRGSGGFELTVTRGGVAF